MLQSDTDDQLMRRVQRATTTAGAMTAQDDRRRMLVIESELQGLRAELDRRGRLLAQQMTTATASFKAVSAYARCAIMPLGSFQARHLPKIMESSK